MNLNVHPLLVHFPIALFTMYSLLEFARFPFLVRQGYYFYLKAFLVIAGVIMAAPTILAGLIIDDQFPNHYLVKLHEYINIAATVGFALLASAYAVNWLNQHPPKSFVNTWWWNMKIKVAGFILQTPITLLITIVAFLLISVGGALGGIIVYGPDIDPFTHIVASLFGIK